MILEKSSNNKLKKIILVIIIIVSLLLIGVGIYFNILSSPKNITSTAIDRLNYLFKNYMDSGDDSFLGDNFTLESDIAFNIKSEYYMAQSKVDPVALQTFNILKNLNDTNTKVTIKQNTKDKKAFFELISNIKEENLINTKYLVDNSTEYYFVEGFLNTYVNNGSCNYFESFEATDNNLKENIEYLYSFILESLKNNLKDEYFEKSITETNVLEKKQQVNLIVLKINDKVYKEILKSVLNDLKNDEKANKIISSSYEDFSKVKVKDSKTYIEENESYTINIYTTKFLNKLVKAEVVYLSGSAKQTISYEGSDSEGNIYFIDNGKVDYIIDCKFDNNKYEFKIKDSANKEYGTLKLEFNSKSKIISLNVNDNKTKIDLAYVSKYVGAKTKSKYTKENKLTFKVFEGTLSKFNGDITITTKASNKADIKEDVTSAVLKSSITEEQQNTLNTKILTVLERLTR